MTPAILVLNAGSSSLKFGLYAAADLAPLRRAAREQAPTAAAKPGETAQAMLLDALLAELDALGDELRLVAAGHRVVHGGAHHDAPARVTPALLAELEGYSALAPQHQPYNLAGIRALARRWPELPQVACFDTAFHRTQPRLAQLFALPRRYAEQGVLRYGFHGLSYQYIATQLPALGIAADARVVVAHLGHGASLCALRGGRSIATTMGFSTLDGLMMGQRCGALDPGVVLHLLRGGLDLHALERLLNEESGLQGVSGLSDDVRVLEASADPRAREALELFAYRVARELGSLVAALGGLEALVFTAGIGEHSAAMRARIAALAGWCGVELDAAANARHARCISTPASRVGVYVVPTDEEIVIARAARP
ncbi:MAG: acetate/propionate family kinase [Steroidobacteraceae bacterium]